MIIKLKMRREVFLLIPLLIFVTAIWSMATGHVELGVWKLLCAIWIFLYEGMSTAFAESIKMLKSARDSLSIGAEELKQSKYLLDEFTRAPLNQKGVVMLETNNEVIQLEVVKLKQDLKPPMPVA